MATFAPAYMGKPANTTIYSKGSTGYSRNKYLNTDKDGKITVAEIGAKYAKKNT